MEECILNKTENGINFGLVLIPKGIDFINASYSIRNIYSGICEVYLVYSYQISTGKLEQLWCTGYRLEAIKSEEKENYLDICLKGFGTSEQEIKDKIIQGMTNDLNTFCNGSDLE